MIWLPFLLIFLFTLFSYTAVHRWLEELWTEMAPVKLLRLDRTLTLLYGEMISVSYIHSTPVHTGEWEWASHFSHSSNICHGSAAFPHSLNPSDLHPHHWLYGLLCAVVTFLCGFELLVHHQLPVPSWRTDLPVCTSLRMGSPPQHQTYMNSHRTKRTPRCSSDLGEWAWCLLWASTSKPNTSTRDSSPCPRILWGRRGKDAAYVDPACALRTVAPATAASTGRSRIRSVNSGSVKNSRRRGSPGR